MRSCLCKTFAGIRRSQVGAVIYAAPIPRLHLLLFCCLKVVRASDLSPPKPAHLLFRIRPLINRLERPPCSRGSAAAGNRKRSPQTRQTAVTRRRPLCCRCLVQAGATRTNPGQAIQEQVGSQTSDRIQQRTRGTETRSGETQKMTTAVKIRPSGDRLENVANKILVL